jgi:branched-chain amino acid transport system substrate-binding protein
MSSGHCLAALPLLLALSGCGARTEPEPFTIGQLASLSGPTKSRGEHARNGAGLAVEVALRGDQRVLNRKVVVRHVDDRGDPELLQAEAVRLLTLNRVVGLIGGPDEAASEQLVRIVQNYSVPVLLPADVSALPAGDSIFCLNAAPERRGATLARYAARDLRCRRVVALTEAREGPGTSLAAGFMKKWRQEHGENKDAFSAEWSYAKETEWPELTGRTLAARPDVVLLAVAPNGFLQLRSRLAAAGLNVPIFYGGEDRGTVPFSEARKEGPTIYLATAFTAGAESGDDGQAFVREYEQQFHEPPDLAAALAYDGVRLLIEALTRAKTAVPARLKAELVGMTDFPGVTGPVSLADRRAQRRLFVAVVRGAETKVVGTIDPGGE